MKISSGWSKGLKIQTPAGMDTRPTRERVRASALNMLQPWISEAVVLDLFAGSGAVGLEMISRGAQGAVFVEQAPGAVKCLRANVEELRSRATKQAMTVSPLAVEAVSVELALKRGWAQLYSIIWADPPYEFVGEFLKANGDVLKRTLDPGGVFALESGIETAEDTVAFSTRMGWEIKKQKTYGVTLITIYQKPDP